MTAKKGVARLIAVPQGYGSARENIHERQETLHHIEHRIFAHLLHRFTFLWGKGSLGFLEHPHSSPHIH
jgi:hypothetical protein